MNTRKIILGWLLLTAGGVAGAEQLYRNEQAWMAGQIAECIAALGDVAAGQPDLAPTMMPGNDSAVTVVHRGAMVDLDLADGIWEPATWAPWATAVFPPASATGAAGALTAAREAAAELLDPRLPNLLAQHRAASALLNEQPTSADAHTRAALLLGVIALNDYAGHFHDDRRAINRMVAHLAIARALGADAADPAARLAEALRLTLCGLETRALAAAEQLGDDTPAGAWRALLKWRNTNDWRDGRAQAAAGPPALQYEYLRALTVAVDDDYAQDFAKEIALPEDATWCRAGRGWAFSQSALELEQNECATATLAFNYAPFLTGDADDWRWVRAYLQTPDGPPVSVDEPTGRLTVAVAGANFFANYHQRHLMEAYRRQHNFLDRSIAVREEADEFAADIARLPEEFFYQPFLARWIIRADDEHAAQRAVANQKCFVASNQHPELLTPRLWAALARNRAGKPFDPPVSLPDLGGWFTPEVPAGTAYDIGRRLADIGVGRGNALAWRQELRGMAPYNYAYLLHSVKLDNRHAYANLDPALLLAWMEPLTHYYNDAVHDLAWGYSMNPQKFEETINRMTEVTPDYYLDLGYYFSQKGPAEKAEKYYLLAYAKARNRIGVANKMGWLIRRLYDRGDKPKAREIAQYGAEIYSASGLANYARLLEREGEWAAALETWQRRDTRYYPGQTGGADACLMRMHAAAPKQAAQLGFDQLLARAFPQGLQKVTLRDFTAPPTDGVRFKTTNQALRQFGLDQGMVIVALDGWRTDNTQQYTLVRQMSEEERLDLIVWDGAAYRAKAGHVKGRMFGVKLENQRTDESAPAAMANE
ncbi:MAG: hypothetical protein LBK60_00955 [Verrucomicrobiales bacterium]|jgi:hypothetical protein|nr:hypothetical protein [Verrucomicrobiales bacterium]